MPITLPNLYTTPQDIYEMVGVDAAQLRLDDTNQASGQQVQTTADAAVGATSLTVAATQYAMLRGTRLVFSYAQMDSPVEVTLSAVANAGATTLSITSLATAINSGSIAVDDGVNVWLAGLMSKACKYATERVQMYCLPRYDDTQLVNSWTVNQWATVIAARWLANRLYRAAPEPVEKSYQDAVDELKQVQTGKLKIPNCGPRTSEWPFLSNVTIDPVYTYRKVRVEQVISEPTVTQYPQAIDWNSVFFVEW